MGGGSTVGILLPLACLSLQQPPNAGRWIETFLLPSSPLSQVAPTDHRCRGPLAPCHRHTQCPLSHYLCAILCASLL